MGYIDPNALAIMLATLGGLVVGCLLHFATQRLVGPSDRRTFAFVVIACLAEGWLAAILAGALIIAPAAGPGPWVMALASAVVIWIGFVLPTTLVSLLHAGHLARGAVAYAAHWFVVMLAQAAILQAVGLIKPA